MLPIRQRISICLCILSLSACSHRSLVFVSSEKAQVSLVEFDDATGNGDLVGETPVTLDIEKLKKQYIRIWGEGLETQYWIVKPLVQERTEISLKLDRREKNETADTAKQKLNLYFRMLIRAYQALSAKEWDTARELAKQLSRETPEAAAPYVIIGLSFLSEGKKSNAKTAFLQAKNLDPEDLDIDSLLRLTKP